MYIFVSDTALQRLKYGDFNDIVRLYGKLLLFCTLTECVEFWEIMKWNMGYFYIMTGFANYECIIVLLGGNNSQTIYLLVGVGGLKVF